MARDPELEKLVEKGRKLAARSEDQAERAAREARDARADEDREEEMRRLMSVSFYARLGWVLAALVAAVGWWFLLRWLLPESWFHGAEEGDPGTGLTVTTMLLLFAPAWWLRRPVGGRAWLREKAWVASLPFALAGYPAPLGRSRQDCVVRLAVQFSGAPPDQATLEAVLRTLGTVEETGTVRRTFDWADQSGPGSNAFVRAHVRDAVKTLRVLHASHPLSTVTVQVTDP